MGVLSRLTKLGGAQEATQGTYVVPSFSIPWDTAEYNDATEPLRDESVRANDSVLQGLTQGVYQADWSLTTNAYPDILGYFLKAMGLFDTVSAGVSTTLTAATTANSTASLSLTASVPNNAILRLNDAAGVNAEYVQIGTVTGSGPFVAPITAGAGTGNTTLFSHTTGSGNGIVTSQTTHTFKQNRSFSTVWPSLSFTTDDGVEQRGWAGCVASEMALKIDPKGLVKISPKFTGWQSLSESTFAYAASTAQAVPGWAWTLTNGGGLSTRGLTMDITLKRAVEAIHGSSGTRGPREVFAGALEIDGTYKAIFENVTDMNLFRNYTQEPTVHTLTQPVLSGGSVLAVTMSQSGYTTAKVANSGPYLQLDMSVSGVQNATDSGVVSATLSNFNASQY